MTGLEPEDPMNEIHLPEMGTRCTDILSDTLEGFAGIHQAEFDVDNGRLSIRYDPHVLTDERALRLVRRAGERAYGRVTQCAQKGNSTCEACLMQMGSELHHHYEQLAKVPLNGQTRYYNGVMEVSLAGIGTTASELAEVEAIPTVPVSDKPVSTGLRREKLEIIFTVLTALTALSAYFGQQLGLLPNIVTALLYGVAYVSGGYYGLLDGIEVLRERRLDVNLLMILASLGAAVVGQPAEGATLLFLFSLSNSLQSFAMDRSRQAIEKLLDLRPSTATVRRGSRLVSLPIEKLVVGDPVLVRPGERFPIDGEVTSGYSTADQSTITGESVPVEKNPGDIVFAGTMNGTGALEIRTTHLAQDTTLAKIVQMVENAQANKAQTQRMLDRFEQFYALLVLAGAALLAVIPLFFSHEFYPTFYRAMTWLVVASPCALVISTPASILSAIANGARRGILFKGGVHLEQTANLKVIAFDKTGTLTTGAPVLTHLVPQPGIDETELLRTAAATEARSEHPLSKAIVRAAEQRGLELPTASEFQAVPGQGVEANVNGQAIWIGGERLFTERRLQIPESLLAQAHKLEEQGQTVMIVNSGGQWLGLLAVADTLRPDAAEIVADLKQAGIERIIMLTGDNERVAEAIAKRAGVDEYHAGLLPADKVRILKKAQARYGQIAMIGDGVNDAPALAAADLGIAMGGAGTDVALETADIVLMADDLGHLPYAIGLARQARRIVWQNLAFSLAVIIFLVVTTFGVDLPLPLGVVGHEGSTVLVVLNGLRLLGYRR